MKTFAPDLSRYWLPSMKGESPIGAHPARCEEDTRAQDVALEQLEHRVAAARTVV